VLPQHKPQDKPAEKLPQHMQTKDLPLHSLSKSMLGSSLSASVLEVMSAGDPLLAHLALLSHQTHKL